MKKIILSVAFIGAFALYVLLSNNNSVSVALPSGTTSNGTTGPSTASSGGTSLPQQTAAGNGPTPASAVTATISNTLAPAKTTPPPIAAMGQYKDGSYTGTDADAYFGKVQVKAIVQGGKLTDVQFLDYPSDRTTSKRISEQAMPVLKSEAIQAQSAQVDVVSGATQTSQGFMQSLADALSQAKS